MNDAAFDEGLARLPDFDRDPALLQDFYEALLVASHRYDSTGRFAEGPGMAPEWQGLAAQAYRWNARRAGQRSDRRSLALRRLSRHVQRHHDDVVRLRLRHGALAARRDDLRRRLFLHGPPDELLDLHTFPSEPRHPDAVTRLELTQFAGDVDDYLSALAEVDATVEAALQHYRVVDDPNRAADDRPDPGDRARETMPPAGSDRSLVQSWWEGLSAAERLGFIAAFPALAGAMKGLPGWARSRANLLRARQDTGSRGRSATAAVDLIEGSVDPVSGEPLQATLLTYDPDAFGGDGAVVLAVGDPDTADNVSVLVPGLGTDGDSVEYLTERALDMHEASRVLDPSESNATVVWIGYDAPDNFPLDGSGWDGLGVVGEHLADEGGDRLAQAITDLREDRAASGAEPANLTIVGHSYGSTTTGHGLSGPGLDVDSAVLTGSPGLGADADHVSDLGLPGDRVFVGANSRDFVADLGNEGAVNPGNLGGLGLGDNPAEDDFGATRFEAENSAHESAHNGYFDHDSESLWNIAHVVNGDYDLVREAGHVTDPWYWTAIDPEDGRAPRPEGQTLTTSR